MKIEIEYGKLAEAINYLYDLNLVRKQSRMRRRLIKMMNDRLQEVENDRKELLIEHSNKDEKGEAIINNGQYDIKDMVTFSHDLNELYAEKMVIEGEDSREMVRTIREVLRKFENEEYQGKTSEIYDYLCEAFGIDEEGGEE